MPNLANINPMVRAIGVFSAVAVLTSGATFAALQSQATLTDNTISSATAALKIDNLENGVGFDTTDEGFAFTGLVPGAEYDESVKKFSLKNDGDTDLNVSLHKVMSELSITGKDGEDGTIDPTKVMIKVSASTDGEDGDDEEWEYTLAELAEMKTLPDGTLPHQDGSDEKTFGIQVKLLAGAVSGGQGQLTNFDLVFTGVASTDGEDGDDSTDGEG